MNQISSRRSSSLLVAGLFLGLGIGVVWAQKPTAPAAKPTPSAGATTAGPDSADKVVLKVGDRQFTKADIDFLFRNLAPQAQRALEAQGKKPLGDKYALIVMLSEQAHQQHLDQTPDFTRKLALQRLQLEAQSALEEINQRAKVTPEQVQQYYTAHAAEYEEIMVRQFVVRKKVVDPQSSSTNPPPPTAPGLSPEEAKTRAAAVRKELLAGTDIKKVVEDFKSSGDVIIEAEPRKVRRGAMRPEMEKVAFALKDGEVSEPVDIPQALVFFQVTGHSNLGLNEVSSDIEKTLRQQAIDAALAEIKKNTAVWMDAQYFAGPPKPAEAPTLGAPTMKTPLKP